MSKPTGKPMGRPGGRVRECCMQCGAAIPTGSKYRTVCSAECAKAKYRQPTIVQKRRNRAEEPFPADTVVNRWLMGKAA